MNKIIVFVCGILLCCCEKAAHKKDTTIEENTSNISSHHLSTEDSLKARVDSLLKKSVPLMGYRFQVTGDFDGDGKRDTLVEHYTDSLRTKEVAKYDEAFDYFDSWFIADQLYKRSFLSATDPSFPQLEGGILGFIYIENCQDITGDGVDDLFVVPHNGGASNCVSGYIYSLKNKEWKTSSIIPIWQWQLPDTPNASMRHGLMGSYDVNYTRNDSINHLIENQLKRYRFIKHQKDESIEYECRNPFDISEIDSLSNLYEQQEFITLFFKPVIIDKKLYLQDKKDPNTFYGNVTKIKEGKKWAYIFSYDDFAEMFTVRVYYKKNRMRAGA